MSIECGKCPKCKSEALTYYAPEPDEQGICYPVVCDDCKWAGRECYDLKFAGYWDDENGEL